MLVQTIKNDEDQWIACDSDESYVRIFLVDDEDIAIHIPHEDLGVFIEMLTAAQVSKPST